MTKKILALALAGTTAFSVFASAMSVNAAWEATQTTNADAYGHSDRVYTATDPVDLSTASAGADTIVASEGDTSDLNAVTIEKGHIYLFDFAPNAAIKTGTTKWAFSDVESAYWNGTDSGFQDALAGYYANDGAINALSRETGYTKGTTTAFRMAVIDDFISTYNSAKSFIVNNLRYTDIEDLYNYNIVTVARNASSSTIDTSVDANIAAMLTSGTLLGDILSTKNGASTSDFDTLAEIKALPGLTSADVTSVPTSELLYLAQEYDRLLDNIAYNTSTEEDYYAALEKVEKLSSEDYSTWNWHTIEAIIAEAEDLAAKAKTPADWAKATAKLNSVFSVEAETADFAELKSLLASLYTDGKIPTHTAAYTGESGDKCVYLSNDYTVKGNVTDEWYEFAGKNSGDPASTSYGRLETLEGAYRVAHSLYRKSLSSSKKYISQTEVNNAIADLESAIAALDPNFSTSDWAILKLQTAIDEADAKNNPDDYRTSSSAWKKFVKVLDEAKALMERSNVPTASLSSKADELISATKALKDVAATIPATTKTELRNLVKEATSLLKNVDGKTAAQIKALTDAKEDGENSNLQVTISDYDALIAALNEAITNFNQIQGWYTTADGKWMYGENDGYYVDGWKKIGNYWFYFNADGTAKANEWFQDGGNWYYAGNTCVAYSGWGQIDGSWYYFSKSNAMCTGWIRPSNSYYYLDPTSGKMVTGWAQIGGKWYYFSTESNTLGAMLTSTTTPDGYQVGADGAMI